MIAENEILKDLLDINLSEKMVSNFGMNDNGKTKNNKTSSVILHCLKMPIPRKVDMNSPASLTSVLSTTDKSCGDIAEPKFIWQ